MVGTESVRRKGYRWGRRWRNSKQKKIGARYGSVREDTVLKEIEVGFEGGEKTIFAAGRSRIKTF